MKSIYKRVRNKSNVRSVKHKTVWSSGLNKLLSFHKDFHGYCKIKVPDPSLLTSHIPCREFVQGTKTRLQNTRVLEHKFNNQELRPQHIFLTTQQDRIWSLIFGYRIYSTISREPKV